MTKPYRSSIDRVNKGLVNSYGEKFRSRVLSVVETCKKRKLSPITVISQIITAVIGKNEYPDVFGLMST